MIRNNEKLALANLNLRETWRAMTAIHVDFHGQAAVITGGHDPILTKRSLRSQTLEKLFSASLFGQEYH